MSPLNDVYPLDERFFVRSVAGKDFGGGVAALRRTTIIRSQPPRWRKSVWTLSGGLGYADNALILSLHNTELHQQVFQLLHLQRGRYNQHLVVEDLLGQIAVLLGLGMLGRVLDNRHAAHLGSLHLIVAGDEVNHLGAELCCQGADQFKLLICFPGIADQSRQTNLTA